MNRNDGETGCSKIIAPFLLFSVAASAAEEGRSELEFFAHEAQTVTASRRLKPAREAPVAVEVISGEEIWTSATNLWDLLRFRVGMDVLDGRSVDEPGDCFEERSWPIRLQPSMHWEPTMLYVRRIQRHRRSLLCGKPGSTGSRTSP